MKQRIRLINKAYVLTLAVGLLLLACLPFSCVAAQPTGSITLLCVYHGETRDVVLAGDTYALVKVANAKLDAATNTLSYQVTDAFRTYDCDWHGCTASQLQAKAYSLKQFVQQENVPVQTASTDAAGQVRFSNLTPGLYLLYRAEAKGKNAKYTDMPALLSIPQIVGADINYDANVYPKFSGDTPTVPSVPAVPTTSPTAPYRPGQSENTPKKEVLPNTGQLNWPIPVLLLLGIGFFGTGLLMRKRTENE